MPERTDSYGYVDAEAVRRYFDGVAGEAEAASFMAHERDLPAPAVGYRLRREREAVADWLAGLPAGARALDVGCGAGAWTEVIAETCGEVVAVDRSEPMVRAARRRLAAREGVSVVRADVRDELPEGPFDLVFGGGICMYLDDADAAGMLGALRERLAPGGVVVLRESTVRTGVRVARGRYQAIYRSVGAYRALLEGAGYGAVEARRNEGYDAMNIAAEVVVARRRVVSLPPAPARVAGALTWWGLRAAAPLSFGVAPRVLDRLGAAWPPLQNHFFRAARDDG